jgi:anti-sigma B factor antagonist
LPWADDNAFFCQGGGVEFVLGTGAGESGVDVNVVYCAGSLDLETVDEFKHRVLPLIVAGAPSLVIDLGGVGFMDSTGLGGLIAALKRAREAEIGLDLVVNTERVSQLLVLTGVDVLLPIYESQQLALASN